MKAPNYNHLFNFYMIGKSGSLKLAAMNLGITQSTLSEQMKRLESDTGQKLFTRAGRSLSLNTVGRRLFEKVEGFYSETFEQLNSTSPGELNSQDCVEIGVTTTISKIFAFEILRPLFKDLGPLIRVTESSADPLLMAFKKQEIDIFITHEKLSNSLVKRLKSLVLKKPQLIVVGGKKFEALADQPPKALTGMPFFLFTVKSQLRWEIEKFFKARNILPKTKAEIDDPEILKAAVLDGLGLAILPEHSVKKELSEKKLFQLCALPQTDLRIYAHYLGNDLTPELSKVVEVLERI